MAKLEFIVDMSDYVKAFYDGYKKGIEDAAQILAPESEIESELNKNGIDLQDGEE